MVSLLIVPRYAALLGLLYAYLTMRVIRYREKNRILLGTQGDPEMERRVRAHGNFAEFAPFIVVLLALLELKGWPPVLLHTLGSALLVGRTLHSMAIAQNNLRLRVLGMVLTMACLLTSSLLLTLA